ncbi:aminomethyl-transferring glycine dehydrogenase subunit GcvPB [Aquifex aeolicus]|uniref:Probable glycine dehydrogenase (decarboxylating) subunit 2 n=1 Tax=Aquifex aeolicus (strain VF5) TaxID=224324 RepID=GCSPB_AQUAE|nr:aminomethyl-transferring glycine dehydrogenase subunit GcvPB [Aquifex aeolicus]O67740.1 RecName: Full=Probable glycine dehydrogenase (decarboxylating) subunit 2; AltName: Full=Glycine cleavage system P-protein subunit 2; AltName: Full=Glycine decarboxylase subunit 2; AltName: Full=Glycine dehydrogenase (aminomethyl-transferring) subunit 2 [Aquifex aeolicus VF5]AAC07701.1 glycine dehydrogenase (decarboxylating) [Aquifex aeolicus VF5]
MELIFEKSKKGRKGYKLPELDVEEVNIKEYLPEEYLREELDFPEVSELDVVRHYTNLSHLNYAVDTTMVPLGSCTMKYNPRINEELVNKKEFLNVHPLTPEEYIQPLLKLVYELKELLKELGGFAEVSLQPAAGAHGELLGLLLIHAYHQDRGNKEKKVVLIPDSAHGTNPASAAICGFDIKVVKSDKKGELDFEDFIKKLDERVAALMITNPNTLGIFERKIKEIAEELHKRDALLYMDGANFNALVGRFKPGEWGVDVMHFNLHKTFSTPHGGGGPGAGPVGVSERLKPYLPVPQIEYDGKKYYLNWNIEKSVGKILAFHGHFLVWLKALAYILTYGKDIKKVSEYAVLNARYLKHLLKGVFKDPYPESPCMHEFVLSATNLTKYGVRASDVAKRILDYGFYAPTMYFPLIVREALMIEPTETENPDTLKKFALILRKIVKEAKEKPEILKKAPHRTPVRRIKEAEANRNLILKFKDIKE